MPGLVYSSDSDDGPVHSRLFGRERPIHQVLGAEKNINVSAALLGVMTLIWFLFEVIFSLYAMSVIGTYFSFLNLLYLGQLGFLCLETLPILYEKFEDDVRSTGWKSHPRNEKITQKI